MSRSETSLNIPLLNSLLETLGPERLSDLIGGFLEKAAEIITQIEETDDIRALYARAHELKGMAANYGFLALSALAKTIEDAAKAGDMTGAQAVIKTLPDAYRGAEKSIKDWLETKA